MAGKAHAVPQGAGAAELRGTARASFGAEMRWCTVSACAVDVPRKIEQCMIDAK